MSHALRLRITGLSLLVVLLIAVGGATGGRIPAAHANTTDVAVIGCEFIAGAVDGNATDAINDADVQAACGGLNLAGVPQNLPATGTTGSGSIAHLADAIGNQDGVLTASDFRSDSLDENWDDNQLSTDCHFGGGQSMFDFVAGMSCTLDVFVFVNHEGPVFLDLPAGLKSIESPGTEDFTCINDATIGTGGFSVTGVSTTGVFTTTAAHNLAVGDTINIAAPIDGVPAGDYMVATVPSTTTFILSGVTVGRGFRTLPARSRSRTWLSAPRAYGQAPHGPLSSAASSRWRPRFRARSRLSPLAPTQSAVRWYPRRHSPPGSP